MDFPDGITRLSSSLRFASCCVHRGIVRGGSLYERKRTTTRLRSCNRDAEQLGRIESYLSRRDGQRRAIPLLETRSCENRNNAASFVSYRTKLVRLIGVRGYFESLSCLLKTRKPRSSRNNGASVSFCRTVFQYPLLPPASPCLPASPPPFPASLFRRSFILPFSGRLVDPGPRGPPLGETLVSRPRRGRVGRAKGEAAYPRFAGINPYKLTKNRGYRLARSRGNPLERGLP